MAGLYHVDHNLTATATVYCVQTAVPCATCILLTLLGSSWQPVGAVSTYDFFSVPAFATATPSSDSRVGDVVCVRHERDVFRVMTSLVQSGSTAADAAVQARSDWNKKHFRTSHPPDMGRRLKELRDEFQTKSDACVARGGKPFFL